VFIGIYPFSQPIGSIQETNLLFGINNKIRWFLKGEWQKRQNPHPSKSRLAEKVLKAYNNGLEVMKTEKKEKTPRV